VPRVKGNLVEVKVHGSLSLGHSHSKVGAGWREMARHKVMILRLAREGGREGIKAVATNTIDLPEKELSRWITIYP
jgi:hypothetical protein